MPSETLTLALIVKVILLMMTLSKIKYGNVQIGGAIAATVLSHPSDLGIVARGIELSPSVCFIVCFLFFLPFGRTLCVPLSVEARSRRLAQHSDCFHPFPSFRQELGDSDTREWGEGGLCVSPLANHLPSTCSLRPSFLHIFEL